MAAAGDPERKPWTVSLAQAFLLITCVLSAVGAIAAASRGSAMVAALAAMGGAWAAVAIFGIQHREAWGWWLGFGLAAYSIVSMLLGSRFSLAAFVVLLLLLDGRSRRYLLAKTAPEAL